MNEITQFGPRELWVVSEPGWSLPVYCDPHTCDGCSVTHWAVRPAIQLLAAPFAKLAKVFAPQNLGKSSTFWVIAEPQLEKFASRARGCMPSDYLKWENNKPGKETVGLQINEDSDNGDEFINFCCDRASIDRPLGRYVWRAIKDGALHWLIKSHKPLDFEIFTVIPVPFRANWKEILLAKHACCAKAFKGKKDQLRSRLVSIGFIQDIGSTDLMAVRRNKSFSWSLEVKQNKILIEEWSNAELINITVKRPARYAKYYEGCIRKAMDNILDVFSSWLQQIQLQVGSIRESPVSCDPIIVPVSKRNKVLPGWHKPSQVTFQPSIDYPVLKQGQRAKKNMESKVKELFNMPPVLPGVEDVRRLEEHNNVDGSRNNGQGKGGVWVPHADKSENEASKLLAMGEEAK